MILSVCVAHTHINTHPHTKECNEQLTDLAYAPRQHLGNAPVCVCLNVCLFCMHVYESCCCVL